MWEDKWSRLPAELVRPLNDLVKTWRTRDRPLLTPCFDAPVLVLVEAPGPATVRPGGSNSCSADTSDSKARTLRRLREQVAPPRHGHMKWNIVPWALHGTDGRWRAPPQADLVVACPALAELMQTLLKPGWSSPWGNRPATG